MTVLYWLHLPEHSDIRFEGYIGVTDDLTKRLRSHKHRFKALWHKIIVKPLIMGTTKYCFDLEKILRPSRKIGWNQAAGGNKNNAMYQQENPNFGKLGEFAPNFIGWYVTPLGKFARPEDAAKLHQCNVSTIRRRCQGRWANNKQLPPQQGYAFEQKGRVKP